MGDEQPFVGQLQQPDLGIVGWVPQKVGDKPADVYVPVRVGTSPDPASKPIYVAQVLSGAELLELKVTLARVGRDGTDEKFLKKDEPRRLHGHRRHDSEGRVP